MDKYELLRNAISFVKKTTPYIVTEEVYRKMFNHHINSYAPLSFSDEDFPNLEKQKSTFKSGKNTLVGYFYKDKDTVPHSLIVFSHGYGGGGHKTYLDLINSFCKRGFIVYGYDATANDESQGDKIRGFTQGYIDADNAMTHIEKMRIYKDFPLYAVGHSWGAFSSSNAIGNHPKIKGLIAFSGFNKATGIFQANGYKYAGEQANEFMPYVDTFENFLFGKDSKTTAIDSFKRSKARIVIVHSEDDQTVPITCGFDLYKEEFKNDKRFLFIKLKDKGHGTVYYSKQGKKYYDDFHAVLKKETKSNKFNEEQKKEYILNTLNRQIYNNMVDENLIDKCVDFILDK